MLTAGETGTQIISALFNNVFVGQNDLKWKVNIKLIH